MIVSRRAKLDWLIGGASLGCLPNAVTVDRGLLEDMRPRPFQNRTWIDLKDAFVFSKSGMKSGNDDIFVSPVRAQLRERIAPLLAGRADQRYDTSLEKFYCYRPLDRRWFFNDLRLLNRPGPMLQRVWGQENLCLYSMPFGTGMGPAVWCHALLPDYHAFSGRGGYAFPLRDNRPGLNHNNLSPVVIESLSAAYGEPVAPEDIFDAILCLLSASTYSVRFAEDLEDVFPHIPFATRHQVFNDAVLVGREIRAVETFAREPTEAHRRPNFIRIENEPRGALASVDYADGSITLCADGSGKITGMQQAIWDFSVSGYRVLPRWLEARVGLPVDLGFFRELRDICGRIAELIDLFVRADIVLEATLQETLTREALGLVAVER